MAFLRYATAIVTHPRATAYGWSNVRTASKISGSPTRSLVDQASEILGSPFDPNQYLLTHCSIVASVDTEEAPNVKIGASVQNGRKVNVKWSDYRITSDTERWINNNDDAFSRGVLAKAYRTFSGAQNFCEHVQILEQSKGRIIDVILRDIGKSLYADILVATDRRHASLVQDIESGRLTTLSMGASVESTTCTKCGHVAVDDTEMCDHIRYEKGNFFVDEHGQRRRIAELCGHESLDPNGGVTFIEASWVQVPAFTGAVMRNIITPEQLDQKTASKMSEILSKPPPQWVGYSNQKAASMEAPTVGGFNFGDEPEGGEGGDDAAPKTDSTPFADIEDRVMKLVFKNIEKKIQDELSSEEASKAPSPEDSALAPNDNVVKEAAVRVYKASVSSIIKLSSGDADVINRVASLDASCGINIPIKIYRASLGIGPINLNESRESYLSRAARVFRRPLSPQEASTIVRLGRILRASQDQLNQKNWSPR